MSRIVKSAEALFGVWILDQLNTRGWSQADLVRSAGIAQSTIRGYISGVRTPKYKSDVEPIIRAIYDGDGGPDEYERFEENALFAAGIVPDRIRKAAVSVAADSQIIYAPVPEEVKVALQTNTLDQEGWRQVSLQIDLQSREAARRRGVGVDPFPDSSTGKPGNDLD